MINTYLLAKTYNMSYNEVEMENREQILQKLINIGILLSSERDLQKLLSEIVDNAIVITKAEGASLYIVKHNTLEFVVFKNPVLKRKLGAPKLRSIVKLQKYPINKESVAGYTATSGSILVIKNMEELKALNIQYDDTLDRKTGYKTKSIIAIPLSDPQGAVIGVLQLVNVPSEMFTEDYLRLVRAMASQAATSLANGLLLEELKSSQLDTIYRLSIVAEFKDKETGDHIKRMSKVSYFIARGLGLSKELCDIILYASPMHDIGKVAIPDNILLKPARLTPQEFEIMKTHTTIGGKILTHPDYKLLKYARRIALYHHEKWDGEGYPEGLAGEKIPLEARITAVADVFDALVSKRPYKSPWPPQQAYSFIVQQKGKHFDPQVVKAFINKYDEIIKIYENKS